MAYRVTLVLAQLDLGGNSAELMLDIIPDADGGLLMTGIAISSAIQGLITDLPNRWTQGREHA